MRKKGLVLSLSSPIKVSGSDSICHGSNQAEMMHCSTHATFPFSFQLCYELSSQETRKSRKIGTSGKTQNLYWLNNCRFSLSKSHCSQPNVLVRHTISQLTNLFKGQPERTNKNQIFIHLNMFQTFSKVEIIWQKCNLQIFNTLRFFSNVDLWPL